MFLMGSTDSNIHDTDSCKAFRFVNNKDLPLLTISLRAIIKPSFIGVTPLAVRPAEETK